MTLRNQLFQNPSLEYKNSIFYQKGLQLKNPFEQAYFRLREKENRIHSDEVVKNLPELNDDHPNKKEWEMRRSTLLKLISYLGKSEAGNILELGCGNGWLSHSLATALKVQICAMDINEMELLQGARVFGELENLSFVYSNIFNSVFNAQKFDAIILGASIQYFPNLKNLFTTLFNLVETEGNIYIVDSPFYNSAGDSAAAKERSRRYFTALGFPEMVNQYFHHTFNELNGFNHTMAYNPKSIVSLVKRKVLKIPLSVFPIICIKSTTKRMY